MSPITASEFDSFRSKRSHFELNDFELYFLTAIFKLIIFNLF